MRRSRLFDFLLILALLFGTARVGQAHAPEQTIPPEQKARTLMLGMSAEERIGQLFLVTFQGTTADDRTQIYELISKYHIGGVVLSRKNNNFNDIQNSLIETYTLSSQLQRSEWTISQKPASGLSAANGHFIPLFVGISQEGDQYPYDQLLSGMTPLPNQMAIGATWDATNAVQVGTVLGRELQALGFNLILGPTLDVLDAPNPEKADDIGTRSFGGSPYWVSEMSQAYISGLHSGSQNRLAVIARNFPGRGSADRAADDEIASVRRTLDQLKQSELVPFFGVMGGSDTPDVSADGLLVSHTRYFGFQGNIRSTTRPLSFDQTALSEVFKLPLFSSWRDKGGLVVSDNLGSPALRRFFDPAGNNFDARQVVRNAFQAGNDLLYVDDLLASGDPDQATTIARTMDFFLQKYREDAAFAQRVDTSVQRILTLKYRLYPEFNLDQVIPNDVGLAGIGNSQQVTAEIASKAVTLISPDAADLLNVVPRPPDVHDRIVFISDGMNARQCNNCPDQPVMAVDALQSAVLRLYGPQAGGQVSRSLLTSYSYTDVLNLLNKVDVSPPVERDLQLADWIVLSQLKVTTDRPESQALHRLMKERPDLVGNKRVIVFAFNAPYYLDATEVSNLAAYYGLYSKSAPFVEIAARILFQEASPLGSLPVTVNGVGYSLSDWVRPDPKQVIHLALDEVEPPATGTATPSPTPVPTFKVGDTIPLRTGVIIDSNNHPVPDGTQVNFIFALGGTSGGVQTVETTTSKGVAHVSYRIDRPGLLEIRASSGPAVNSDLLQLDITGSQSAVITVIVPTQQPTLTPTVTLTPAPTLSPVPEKSEPQPDPPSFMDWLLAIWGVLGCAGAVIWLGPRLLTNRWAVRWGLCMALGGLLGYNYLALRLPGSQALLERTSSLGVMMVSLFGVALGGLAGWLWRYLDKPSTPPQTKP